ncbi:MAG: hypothetical protein K5907_00350 [Treponema sp.]|nr:hypothetical protein [Treponema sp.]
MTNNELYSLIYSKYGIVTRARGCFLYTKKGARLTDLYQENGRAILGWDGKNAFTFFKNVLNKGLTGGFICEEHSRLQKAVGELLASDRKVAFFSTKAAALKAGLAVSATNTCVYKPWNPADTDWSKADCVVIVPPLPWTDSIFLLAVKKELAPAAFELSISVPFAMQAGITRAFYNLIQAIGERTEKDWFIYDPVLTRYWERKGPYLFPKISENIYDEFVRHCAELGIVINPSCNEPSIIPFGADAGVFTKLKNSPFKGDL